MGHIDNYLQEAGQLPVFKNVLPQYYMTVNGQNINIQSQGQQWLGAWMDTGNAYPAPGSGDSCGATCISDGGIDNEVQRALVANPSWERGLTDVYLVFPAQGWNICSSNVLGLTAQCSTPGSSPQLCGYHAFHPVVGSTPLFYGAVVYPTALNGCQWSNSTNQPPVYDPVIDGAIVITEHEYAELITDPNANGWCGQSGWTAVVCSGNEEIGDKCGGAPRVLETYAADTYWVQQLWDNSRHKCTA
jgi:hypothetical protein